MSYIRSADQRTVRARRGETRAKLIVPRWWVVGATGLEPAISCSHSSTTHLVVLLSVRIWYGLAGTHAQSGSSEDGVDPQPDIVESTVP